VIDRREPPDQRYLAIEVHLATKDILRQKPRAMILLIDNYDSFTFNLYHFLGDVGARCEVWRNDKLSVADAMAMRPEAIVLSPGPCTPTEAGICLGLIAAAAGEIPLLGVCLGHQAIGQAFGGKIIRAPEPMHGKVSAIIHSGTDILENLPSPFSATRYHSLIVERDTLPDTLVPTAWTENPGAEPGNELIMAMHHRTLPIYGVQFHPESIASEHGHRILANFLALARGTNTPATHPLGRAA
jgi:anthranilate synthase/aminodeoxychorismate synthase-like glutamine amidotransferase